MATNYAAEYEKLFGKKPDGQPGSKPLNPFMDWYTNSFNPVKPSQAWTNSKQQENNAIATGSAIRPGPRLGETVIEAAPGAVDASTGETVPSAPKPTASTGGRSDTRVIPGSGGQTQTGTNMGKISVKGLEEMERYAGASIANFAGPSFPTQAETNKTSDGYSNTSAQQMPGVTEEERGLMRDAGFMTAGDLDGFKPGGKFTGAPTATEGLDSNSPEALGNRANQAYGGAAGLGEKANQAYDRPGMTQTLGDSSGLRYDASKYKGNIGEDGPSPMDYAQSGEEMRRRSAFLDAPDSMQGLRNVEAGMGMVYAGGNHYANVNGEMKKMDSDGEFSARTIKGAAPGKAQAIKDKWVSALTNQKKEEPQTASSAQNPTIPSGTSTITVDKEIALPGDAKGIDYLNNNDNDTGIAERGGTSMPDSFKADDDRYNKFKPQNFYIK